MKILAILALLSPISALAVMKGAVQSYSSPNGVTEQCIAIEKIPGGLFSPKDEKTESKLCSLDIYRNEVAVCPKTWSTSAGTMFYSTEGTGLSQEQYEAQANCGTKKGHKTKLGKFKTTMNRPGTSGTFSQSSLLYYQFSRYFQTIVQVPVAVYRSFDRIEHFERVSRKAKGMGSMNIAAWNALRSAASNPSSYSPSRDLVTPDLQFYGALLDDSGGERYETEINGVRSAWGDAQNRDFQNTPAFTALRSDKPFAAAVAEGLASVRTNAKISADMGKLPAGPVQMGLWMKELSEITLLDYIFSQQDRVGNIDFDWYWVYADGGSVKAVKEKRKEYKDLARKSMKPIAPPEEIAKFEPVLVQKSRINDNDAGGLPQYVNYTKRTKMLEKIRHFDADIYRRLLAMNADFSTGGTLLKHLKSTYFLTDAQISQVVKNTAEATKILQTICAAGALRFDLNFDRIVKGEVVEEKVDCGSR